MPKTGTVKELRDHGHAAEAHYRAVFLSIDDAVVVADGNSRYIDANPAATTLLGYTRDELLQMQVGDVVAAGLDWTAHEYRRFLQDGHWRGELDLLTRMGTLITVDANASVVQLRDQNVYVSILRDISARQRADSERNELLARERTARAQAEAAILFRNDVIATIAHDVGNPLTAIKALAQMLKRQRPAASPQATLSLDRIEQCVGQMQAVLAELSDLASLQVGARLHLARRPTDLVSLVRRLVDRAPGLDRDTYV